MSNIIAKISNNKTGAIAIAIFFILSMSASMMLLPTTSAQASSTNITTYAYISAAPNPTGVGQQVEIIMWVQVIFGNNAMIPNNYRFGEGTATDPSWTLVVTAPDGTNTTTTLGIVSSTTSDYDHYFTPTTTGTYILTFKFPATTVTVSNDPTSALIGDTYLPATASTNLTVQQTAIAALPSAPLPTTYWTRPIYGENSAWYTLGSNWLGFGSPSYISIAGGPNLGANGEAFGSTTNVGPLTSHIMWTKPLAPGGIVGQTATPIAGNSYADGSAYDQKYQNPIIVDGMLIYTEPISQTCVPGALSASVPSEGPTVCVNLQTGQQIWSSSTIPALSFAYVYDAEDPNQHGVWPPMLVASTYDAYGVEWEVFDAFTGAALFNVSGIPSGVTMLGPSGEYLVVSLVNLGTSTSPNWYLQEWNSSKLWDDLYSGTSTTPTIPPPISNGELAVTAEGVPTGQPVTATWTGGYIFYPSLEGAYLYVPSMYDYNVSLPWLNTATLNGAPIGSISGIAGSQGGMLLAYAGNFPSAGENIFFGAPSDTPQGWFGIGLNATAGTLGTELWHTTLTAPPNNLTVCWGDFDPVANVYVLEYRETMQYIGYSLSTGAQIWGPTPGQTALDYYGCQASGSLATTTAYGNTYSCAYAGILYCYSDTTGKTLWTFGNGPVGSDNSTDSGVETPFGNYPTFVVAIGSGVVYVITSEHTEETPIFKGAVARAINATTGQQIWTLSDYTGEFFTGSYAIADGYSTFFNGYDNQIYVVGKGPSATTVTAPQTAITAGTNVIIQGTVMDISAGTTQTEQAADFPNGVPVASDASMAAWMGYVYQQQAEPTNFTGVTVTLTAVDPNHNFVTIGEVTTDSAGAFSYMWTPPSIPGQYTVTATFCGTNGYYGSSAETAMAVQNAPPTPAPTASPPTGLASTASLELGIVAVIIVIIIIGAILALLLMRKRP